MVYNTNTLTVALESEIIHYLTIYIYKRRDTILYYKEFIVTFLLVTFNIIYIIINMMSRFKTILFYYVSLLFL